jgi:HD-GYP domain-containing protein (c-di-GMP phosphodiesterase class II)
MNMWKKPENPIPIGNLQLRIGVFVWVDRSWKEHPFIYNKFRITSDEQLRQVLALGPERVYWIPAKSTAEPGPPAQGEPELRAPIKSAKTESFSKKNDEMNRQRALISKAERDWEQAAKLTTESLLGLRDNPKQAGTKMRDLSKSAAQSVSGGEALLHMLGDKDGQGPQHHALNCMTISMLVAKAIGLPAAAVNEVALGALAHDVGSTMIPRHILRANKRTKVEENLYRDHCRLGVELALMSGAFSEGAIAAIRDHHEALDGSGFPSGKSGAAIGLSARIVAVADHYDRLCSPQSPEKLPMLPANALRKMWKEEQSRLDPAIIAALIRLLGIYPPGTIVSLNDGSLGLVVSPGKKSLFPKVMIYDPDVPKEEAPVIDLEEGGTIVIEEALNPTDIPEDALQWISPRERITYYFTASSDDQ